VTNDARAWVRYASDLEILCELLNPWEADLVIPVRLVNISREGACLVLNRPVGVGEFLILDFPVASVFAQVVRGARSETGWNIGCQFTRLLGDLELQAIQRAE
jgi:hypothetical protein